MNHGARPPMLGWLLMVWQLWVLIGWWKRFPLVPAHWIDGFRTFFLERTFSFPVLLENWSGFLAGAGALLGLIAVLRRLGEPLVRAATRRSRAANDPLAVHAAGLAVLGLLALGAGLCGLIGAAPGAWGLAGLALTGGIDVVTRPGRWRALGRTLDARPDLAALGAPARLAALALLAITGAHILGIETGWDAMTYHLRFPSFYLLRHKVFDLWHQLAGAFPQHGEMVFLVARALGGDLLARFLNVFVGGLALAAARRVAARLGAPAGWTGVLLTVSPLVALLLTRCYLDLFTLLWGGAVWLGLLAWRRGAARAGLLAAGLAAGLAMSTKYTAVMLLPAMAAWLWSASRGARSRSFTGAYAPGVAAMAGVLGPWLIRNYLHRGNPVAPLLSDVFGLHQDLSGDLALPFQRVEAQGRVLASSLAGRLEALCFNDGRMQGPLGPAFAAVLPLALLGVSPGGPVQPARRGMLAFVAAWLILAPDIRFLTPVLPLACGWLAVAAAPWLRERRLPGRLFAPGLEAGVVVSALFAAGYQWGTFAPFSMPLGLESRRDKLELGLRPAPFLSYTADAIHRRVPPRDRILLATHFTSYYIERECLNDVHFGTARVARLVRAGRTSDGIARVLRQRGIRWVLGCGSQSAGFALIPAFFDAGPGGWEAWKRLLATRADAVWMTNEFTLYRLGERHPPRPLPALPPLDGAFPDDPRVADTGAAAARRAAACEVRREFRASAEAWGEALRRGLDTPAVRLGLARALVAQDRPAEALPHVLRALEAHPRSAYGRGLLAVILAGMGDRDGARAAIAAAIRLDPANPEYRRLAEDFGPAR